LFCISCLKNYGFFHSLFHSLFVQISQISNLVIEEIKPMFESKYEFFASRRISIEIIFEAILIIIAIIEMLIGIIQIIIIK